MSGAVIRVSGVCSLGLLLVTGCVDPGLDGLDHQLDGFKRQEEVPVVAPLPEIARYVTPSYAHAGSRSPFKPHQLDASFTPPQERTVDSMRQREPLEHYDLSELTLVGTLMVAAQPSALLRSPEGRVHRLQVGSYLGSNASRIVGIHGGFIMVEERVMEGGAWVARQSEMRLRD